MKDMTGFYIGIDTGRNTGFAVWDGSSFRELDTRPLHRALFAVRDYAREWGPESVTIYIEDARLRKWIPKETNRSEYRGKLMGAGSVKRDATIWEEFCEDYGIQLVLVPPKYNTTKLAPQVFARITGYKGRTSEHARDAAMLVFGK